MDNDQDRDKDVLGPSLADLTGPEPDTEPPSDPPQISPACTTRARTSWVDAAGTSVDTSPGPGGAVEGFTTASGSAYEVDLPGHRIRRLGNAAGLPATPRQGHDGQWRTFHTLALSTVAGEQEPSILVVWDETGTATITSMITTLSPGMRHLVDQDGLGNEGAGV